MKPLRAYEPFLRWMRELGDTPLYGALVGCIVTLVIQSSSATVAIVVTLAGSVRWISGGADVGRQVANAQILFNVIGVAAVLPFLPLVARVLERLIPDASESRERLRESVPAT